MDGKTVFLLISLLFTTAAALIGYDCGRRANNVSTISLREVDPCEIVDSNPEIKNVEMRLLQRLEYEPVQVTTCRIRVDRHIFVCGMFSHQSEVKTGEQIFFISISRDICYDIHRFGSFEYEKIQIHDIRINSTTRVSMTVAGSLSEDGKCSGTTFKTDQHDYEDVVVTAKLEIDVSDYMASANRDKDELILQSGTRCSYKDTKCTDADGKRSFWEYIPTSPCNYNQYVLLFDGKGVKVGNNTLDNPNVYFANTTEKIQFGLMKTGEVNLCGYQLFSTDHPKLFITEYPRGTGIAAEKSLDVHDILITAYFNTKIAFLAHHMKTQFSDMYNDMLLNRCRLQRQVIQNSLMHMYTKPDVAALTIMRKPGYMAVPVGEVAHLVVCDEILCKVRQVEECFQEIPVTCRNESYFLKPFSRIMTKTGTARTCNNILPALYLIEESWLKFSPGPNEGRIPQILEPQTVPTWHYQDIKGLIDGGIYTADDLDRLHKHSTFPAERHAYIEEVARRLSDKSAYSSSIDFGNLVDQKSLKKIVQNAFKNIWNGFTEFGIVSAGIMGIITIFSILKLVFNIFIHGYTLHSIYGWSIHLLGALFGSVTHLLVTLSKKTDENEKKKTEYDEESQKYTLSEDIKEESENVEHVNQAPSAPLPLESPKQGNISNNFSRNLPRSDELERRLFQYFNKTQN
ncbi:hypothetical protein TSAR_013300 [Trichomalopsis sarcophagae]|uniref:Glycoprotein n=1 Tax=Trichomalopsis sarcophagae TaxID=543379 RepID=A0A232EE88_9HYME|nr:hypothetical protein TSAR_013300 [Trichomalopsis sarcophagae]